jgi:hypothetical protein
MRYTFLNEKSINMTILHLFTSGGTEYAYFKISTSKAPRQENTLDIR